MIHFLSFFYYNKPMPKKTTNASLPKKSCDFFFCPEKKISAFFLPPQNSQIRTTCKLGGHDLDPKKKKKGPTPNVRRNWIFRGCVSFSQPRKIQFLRTFGVGPFFFFFGSNQRERYFSMEHGRWKVARRSLHQLPQPPPETFDDDNPQPPKINWSP